jgi:hypothetical protein
VHIFVWTWVMCTWPNDIDRRLSRTRSNCELGHRSGGPRRVCPIWCDLIWSQIYQHPSIYRAINLYLMRVGHSTWQRRKPKINFKDIKGRWVCWGSGQVCDQSIASETSIRCVVHIYRCQR